VQTSTVRFIFFFYSLIPISINVEPALFQLFQRAINKMNGSYGRSEYPSTETFVTGILFSRLNRKTVDVSTSCSIAQNKSTYQQTPIGRDYFKR
jgi:hypothetical protein